jgi:hypothetical protein
MMKRNADHKIKSGKPPVNSTATPNCAFCKGAGEPIQVYTSHWQFSKPVDGKLTCPKLLKHCCKNCNTNGHIEKRCPFPKAKATATDMKTSLYCKFCHNAGKVDYATHNQFDNKGFVQCEVLLNIECQLCGENGHTKRYCPTPSSHQASSTDTKKQPLQKAPLCIKRVNADNKFSVLQVFLSDEDEEELKPVVEKKQTQEPTVLFTSPVNSWAGRVAASNAKQTVPREAAALPNAVPNAVPEAEPVFKSYTPESTSWGDSEW